ncbi:MULTISPECIES: DUF4367 domain-containing protein [unclassified Paenibacillus]|uniref:DUF4367 domain-containing protein n=1 Tax=unclassified Paenibacillus TaxID=185978 RepID=UPI0030F68026
MENKYNEVMEKIEVTAEMQTRILNHLQQLDWEQKPKKVIHFPNYKRYMTIAACFLFLLVGSVVIHNVMQTTNEPPVLVTPDIVEVQSIEQLSKGVGFTMKEITDPLFSVKQVKYTSYWNDLGEIIYSGEQQQLVFRMSSRNEDVSGDYAENTSKKDITINRSHVTLKGNDNHYVLAIWQSDGFSYSVQFTEPVSEQEMIRTVESVR